MLKAEVKQVGLVPMDVLKDPCALEFLDFPAKLQLQENQFVYYCERKSCTLWLQGGNAPSDSEKRPRVLSRLVQVIDHIVPDCYTSSGEPTTGIGS